MLHRWSNSASAWRLKQARPLAGLSGPGLPRLKEIANSRPFKAQWFVIKLSALPWDAADSEPETHLCAYSHGGAGPHLDIRSCAMEGGLEVRILISIPGGSVQVSAESTWTVAHGGSESVGKASQALGVCSCARECHGRSRREGTKQGTLGLPLHSPLEQLHFCLFSRGAKSKALGPLCTSSSHVQAV